jgi:tetratricopeptide (TPR) repeat protein
MKVKYTLVGFFIIALVGMAQAQEGWNWPANEELEAKAREYNASYVDYMKSEQFVEATKPLNWLYTNVPNLNESIYINGVTVYHGAAGKATEEEKKKVYQDSVITVFEMRKANFDNETKWIENKAYYSYNYYKANKNKVGDALATFDRVVELNGNFNTINLVAAYFDLVYRHNAYNKAFTKVQLLERYEKLNVLLAEAEAEGKDISAPKQTLEQLVVAMELIDCEFIETTLSPKLIADPTNMVLAQQIFKYSIQYKCTSSPTFLTVLEMIDSDNPTFSTSQVRAMRYMQNREYEKALPVLERALTLAENNTQKAEVYFDLAKIHAQSGRKSTARSSALEAGKVDPEKAKDAWELIAQLYMGSYNDCRKGISRVEDQAIFIAAYNAYQRAGDSKGMSEARARFPSKEELFTESRQPGETFTINCWIGETVTLATRD